MFLTWCQERDVEPMAATRVHLELFLRWMQETRRYKPSTVSRRLSVVTGFYRIVVVLELMSIASGLELRRRKRSHDSARFPAAAMGVAVVLSWALRWSTRSAGTGIGLATVQRIAQAHHGHLDITQTPGGGATLTLHAPTQARARQPRQA